MPVIFTNKLFYFFTGLEFDIVSGDVNRCLLIECLDEGLRFVFYPRVRILIFYSDDNLLGSGRIEDFDKLLSKSRVTVRLFNRKQPDVQERTVKLSSHQ
jgi:hypothetical protein